MKHLKLYEEFNFLEFQPEMISEQEYQRVKKSGIHLRFSTRDVARLYTNSRRGGPGNLPRIVSWVDGNSRGYIGGTFNQVIKNVELKFSTRFEIISIEKEDEPFVYFTIDWGYRNSMVSWRDTLDFPPDSKLYGRMEYEEFEMVREDAKLWKDFCVNVVVEEDRKNHNILKESLFNEIPDPEIMTLDEYDDEINNGKEEKFNQKEKELFISLSDTIPLKHKPYSPEFWDSQISFSMVNGDDGIYPELESTDVLRSITTYKNEDEFYYVNVWEREWVTEDDNGTKSYRCDGYECWEKFLKEIFQDYRDLINTKDNKVIKESFGGPIPDPEPMDVNEWDEEVTNAQEVAFTQKGKELFISLSDTIYLKNKLRSMPDIGKFYLYFQLLNGDLNPKLRETTPISNISIYKNDDEFYFISLWTGDGMFAERELWAGGEKLYRCDGYECWEKFLKEIFAGYRKLINKKSKTNESYFDEVPEPKSLLDENGDITDELSSDFETRDREPFTKNEKLFIDKLISTLNEEYTSIKFYNNNKVSTEFRITMGDMAETTHIIRGVKFTDEYYGVEYENFIDSEDEYIISECDGFECLSKLLIRLFEKINKDYDYEGN